MRTFLCLAFTVCFLDFATLGLRSDEPLSQPVSLPVGKLAFVTGKRAGSAGPITVVSGTERTLTKAFPTHRLELLPDGIGIIYVSSHPKTKGMYIYDMQEHGNIPLLSDIAAAGSPSLSPDGA